MYSTQFDRFIESILAMLDSRDFFQALNVRESRMCCSVLVSQQCRQTRFGPVPAVYQGQLLDLGSPTAGCRPQ